MNSKKDSSVEKGALICGFFISAVGIFFNEVLLAAFFSGDGILDPTVKSIIRIFDIGLIVAGISLVTFRKRLNFNLTYNTDSILKGTLVFGIVLRVIVFFFLEPHNNDPHFEYIQYINDNGALPHSAELTTSFHPPLYYLIASTFALTGSEKVVQFFSLLCSVGTLWCLYVLIKNTRIVKERAIRCHMFFFAAVLPQFVLFGSFISNDSLSFLIGAIAFLLAFRYIDSPSIRNLIWLALIIGAGLLTKGSFLAFCPIIAVMILLNGLQFGFSIHQNLKRLIIFSSIVITLGSYKFIENTIYLGKPVMSGEDTKGSPMSAWLERQSGTYQGLSSIVDINVLKLVNHPYVSAHTKHSLPLLMYGTFWYSYIKESNFNKTRDYPFTLIPRTLYLLAIIPSLIIAMGGSLFVWRNRKFFQSLKSRDEGAQRLKEIFLVTTLILNIVLVITWGLKHDAWSFFQARLIFPSIFPVLVFLGIGIEIFRNNTWLRRGVNTSLGMLYALMMIYYATEIGSEISARLA